MLELAIVTASLVALGALLAALLRAAAEASEEHADKAESLGFLRLILTGTFGVVLGQGLSPLPLDWWWTATICVSLMIVLLFGSQLVASRNGHKKFGSWLLKLCLPLVRSWSLLFTPLSLPKDEEPEEYEQELLDSVEEFGETIVREIMVPRVDMATVKGDAPLSEAMQIFLSRGYSRLPVTGKGIDDIVGVMYLKDSARAMHESKIDVSVAPVKQLMRPAIFVPESMAVDALLRMLQNTNRHIAIVVDEYGGVAGLVTLEDVIEELVGEISDEYDAKNSEVDELEPGRFRVSARFSLFDLGELFNLELEDDEVDTVGGILAKELGRLPARGDSVVFSGLKLTAEQIEGRRKRLVSVLVEQVEDLEDARSAFVQLEDLT